MKKLILVWMTVIFLFACSNKEETSMQPFKSNQGIEIPNEIPCAGDIQKLCTIDGYDCCKIIHLLEKTEIVFPSKEEIEKHLEGFSERELLLRRREIKKELTKYKNPELAKIGLSVTNVEFAMGPYKYYQLSNGIEIAWNFDPSVQNYRVRDVTLIGPDGTKRIFNTN